jgi:two-component system, NtrC family, nitrogen regulation sensor histidine kinase NtrY
MRARLTVGGRFLAIVLLVAVLPLVIAGVWLVRDAGRAGEGFLDERMNTALQGLADEVGAEWLRARSRLLDLADAPEVRARLRASGHTPADVTMEVASAEVSEIAHRLELRDVAGRLVSRYESPVPWPGEGLRVELPIHAASGEVEGVLEAWIRLDTLLGRSPEWTARTGGVIGALEPDGEVAVLSTPFDARLLTGPRFQLGGEEWITRRHTLLDPPAILVLAAPLGPYREPFREAARRGIFLILAVALTGFAAAALLTRQTTRPLAGLVRASQAVARGEMGQSVTVRGPREVRELGEAFNAMAETLQQTLNTLAKREALAAVGEFAAVLAHEIRNPLTAIRIDLQRVDEVSHDEARRRTLTDRMLAAVRRLDRAVSGVLCVARSGRVELAPTSLRDPLEAALETARPTIEAAQGELRTPFTAPDLPRVLGDRAALEQLFLNLLLNAGEALDGAAPRWVEVQVGKSGDGLLGGETVAWAEVRIRDTGRGIPIDQVDRVFEPLYSTKDGGTGLGLAIAERIARAHGGEIRVDSQVGRGTTMTVRLPLAAEPADPELADPELAAIAGATGATWWDDSTSLGEAR